MITLRRDAVSSLKRGVKTMQNDRIHPEPERERRDKVFPWFCISRVPGTLIRIF